MNIIACKVIITSRSGETQVWDSGLDVGGKTLKQVEQSMNEQGAKDADPFTVQLIKIDT